MKIFVTVELFGACIENVRATKTMEKAEEQKEEWRKINIIRDDEHEEEMSYKGTEFRIFECEVEG